MGSQGGFDVVVVPDFEGPRARTFEAQTLLFLGSWLENAGVAGIQPLHVACIGAPPPSVRALARRAGAAVTIHEPVRANQGRNANKLRGLEIGGGTPFGLLLDADIVVLGDPSELVRLGPVVAVALAKRLRIPETDWARMFTACGLPPPAPAGADLLGRQHHPYYNSGVVYLPWGCGLREAWEQDLRTIAELFRDAEPVMRRMSRRDQFGLAVALERLRHRGTPVVLLPKGFNVVWHHLRQGLVTRDEIRLFHATNLFRGGSGRERPRRQLRRWRIHSLWISVRKTREPRVANWRVREPARWLRDVYSTGLRIQRIWDRQVEPMLPSEETGPSPAVATGS